MALKNILIALLFFPVAGNIFAADAVSTLIEEKSNATPQRIVSINLCTDELLVRLVSRERIAALTKHSENPDISTIAATVHGIKKIRGSVEDVISCNADLLIGGRFSHKETLHFFQYSEIPVLVFNVPKNFEDIYTDIRRLAKAVSESEKGEQIIKEMEEELLALKRDSPSQSFEGTAPLRKQKRAIFFQSGNLVPGSGTFENAIMEAASLENVAVSLGIQEYGSLPLEKLIEIKPDILIFSSDQKQGRTVRGEVLSHPAIKDGLPGLRTVTIPSSFLNCGSPASVEAVRLLVKETNL